MERFSVKYVNLIEAPTLAAQISKIDLAIRIGALPDSTLNARRLGSSRVRDAASCRAWLERLRGAGAVPMGKLATTPGLSKSATVGVQLSWPIYTGGAVENRLE